MTYVEAAVEVLREAGRPLHFKKITEVATKRALLSHVGKAPEEAMRTRLEFEAKRTGPGTIIEEVRPGVFGLRAGADLDDARQTLVLRAPGADEIPEPEPVIADEPDAADTDVDAGPAPAASTASADDGRRKRRGRRGGRRRQEAVDGGGDAEDSSDDDAPEAETTPADPAPRVVQEAAREPARTPGSPAERPAPVSAELLDVAAGVLGVLARRPDANPLSATRIAEDLARAGVGALGVLGTSGLRGCLHEANARQSRDGRPPIFEETKPNFWTLAAATGSSLARSYASLDAWQAQHRAALLDTIAEKLGALPAASLGTITTLLLDRSGYTGLKSHGGDPLTIAARSPRGLTHVHVAVRVFPHARTVDRDAVAALRGGLHAFGATEGVILAFGRLDSSARDESAVANLAPVSVLGLRDVAGHLISAGVAVTKFSVDVSCVDDAFLRELRGQG